MLVLWLLPGLVPLCGALVGLCIRLISRVFGTALWLLPGGSSSLFSTGSLALVLGLGSLDNVVYKEN